MTKMDGMDKKAVLDSVMRLSVGDAMDLTKQLNHMFRQDGGEFPFPIGSRVLIRTVTMINIGTIVDVGKDFIKLKDGGWVADTGLFSKCLSEGTVSEFEGAPGEFIVGRGGIIDVFPWEFPTPKNPKGS